MITTELKIKDVAEKTDLHRSIIELIERGERVSHLFTLRKLATVYRVEIKDLL